MKGYGNYDKYPELNIRGYEAWEGYRAVGEELLRRAAGKKRFVIVFDCYTEVEQNEVKEGLSFLNAKWFDSDKAMMSDEAYNAKIRPFVTDDRVFGIMNTLKLADILDENKVRRSKAR